MHEGKYFSRGLSISGHQLMVTIEELSCNEDNVNPNLNGVSLNSKLGISKSCAYTKLVDISYEYEGALQQSSIIKWS